MSTNDTDELFALDVETGGREESRFAILQRPRNHPDFVRYAAPGAKGVVYLHRAAWFQMRDIALGAGRNEAIAMLLGRPCTDEHGDYTLVLAVEAALPGEYVGTPGFVKISTEGKAALKDRSAQKYFGLEDVGWFHTHPLGEPRFSQTDFDEQATRLDHQVGIVAASQRYQAGRGEDPLGVYLGPVGHRLSGSVPPPQLETVAPAPVGEPVEAVGRRPRYFTPEMLSRLPIGGTMAVLLLVLTQVGLATWLHGAIRTQSAVAATPPPMTTVITRTRHVVRVVPALFVARQCAAGGQISVPVRVPSASRYGLSATVLNPAVASASHVPSIPALTVACRSAGTTAIELHDPVSGATASLIVTVAPANRLEVHP